ncbi:4-(cytidine 5'-diphospho)-2-C-methyl-D-erythritol kinase [Brevundimonas lenta]|uniref:4-diphosphocytidyl-2-C-methyl-D-erythritol kinase n=1 Tax=Brevundimonas lenta TaxID=424796 RepID=A0A7W6JGS1_9CAUL|nr:4-(cytidine 5'-diphospho)-2-C-methyl-D-erythritol kinase [Brevundimonas lenta]MBB4083817.1 4-diphosphocytidyl-2-C-methyl-D-erythritol kinase [Brevundimonas lenta]
MAALSCLAPAKVNLFLHVGPLDRSGFHPLASLVAFADIGDRVTVEPSDKLSMTVTGSYRGALAREPDNLVLRALRALGEAAGIGEPKVAVTLHKQLPIAAGLGGGTADAGAALKLARDLLELPLDDHALAKVAEKVGADGPMCLHNRAAWATGFGHHLTFEPRLAPLAAVLVNPDLPCPTGAVYRGYDSGDARNADIPSPPTDWSAKSLIGWLADHRNDLEPAAIAIEPEIGRALKAVEALPGCRVARMSGSGATVFGLFDTRQAADAARDRMRRTHELWWVESATLS